MDDSLTIEAVLNAITGLTLRAGIRAAQRAEFTRLYALYQELEITELDPPLEPTQEEFRANPAATDSNSPLDAYLRQQAALRERYGQRLDFFLVLKSFYDAFIFPLEQDLAIVQSCQVLGISQLALPRERAISTQFPRQYDATAAARALYIAKASFLKLGRLLFPNTFTLNDFTGGNQNQAG